MTKARTVTIAGNLEGLIEAIVNEAKAEAQKIIAKAKEKAEEVIKKAIDDARCKAEFEASDIIKRRREEALRVKRSELAKARMDAMKKVLDYKEKLIESVFEEAKKRVQDIVKTQEYKMRLIEILKEAVRVLGGGIIEVRLSRRDLSLNLDLNVIARELSDELNKPVELRISNNPGDFLGGLVARSIETGIEVDYTIEGILERKHKNLRIEVAKQLFAD
ncbi:MAG: V-type ATP synthase subunit E family protein [Candidatus Nezhaarchaeota archaeon]|nr:V-type ATP synthase subunit E family protein [Candidatus Nezhaarchaeota archaeon]MCX8141687.1 V-type ATP synthase subunit E family protein [Candidatus Nezhaarchaeota archaeon]MDW8049954.1 V-type ATP synthase subunit E family protein [Nitrososphaerota archaeon]